MNKTWFRRLKTLCFYWLPLIFWMALIFWLSSQPVVPHPGRKIGVPDDYTDYAAHAFMFAILTLLAWHALRASPARLPTILTSRPWLSAAVLAALYAISDEMHQLFVPGRWAKVSDWLADCVGILAMAILLVGWQRAAGQHRKSKAAVQRRIWE